MGYSYDKGGRLCCDRCGKAGGVRKRTCPHRVTYPGGASLPYCPARARCDDCLRAEGGNAKLHAACAAPAAARTLEEARKAARLAAGDLECRTGWGSWHPAVPAGWVGRRFVGTSGQESFFLIPDAVDDAAGSYFLSDYREAARRAGVELLPWSDPDRPTGSKCVEVAR